jgi:enamine deaminase RidA (YjgF/YER057c/UK114 family)
MFQRAVIQNLSAILEQAGSSLGSILKVNIFITSIDDFKAMNEVYEEFFSKFPIKPVGHFKI